MESQGSSSQPPNRSKRLLSSGLKPSLVAAELATLDRPNISTNGINTTRSTKHSNTVVISAGTNFAAPAGSSIDGAVSIRGIELAAGAYGGGPSAMGTVVEMGAGTGAVAGADSFGFSVACAPCTSTITFHISFCPPVASHLILPSPI